MAKYLIKVEQAEGTFYPDFKEAYAAGVECDGFLIVGKKDGGAQVAIHGMNLLDIAASIKGSKHLENAAKLVCLTNNLGFLKEDDDDD